jgi:hypothetical protein
MALLRKRAVRAFAAIFISLFWELGLIFILALVSDYFEGSEDLLTIIFFGTNLLIPALLIFYPHRWRDQWIEEEAENWLVQRSAQAIAPSKRWVRTLRRGMLWAPSLIALSVLLFLPEAMGIVSHVFDRQSHDLNDHRLHLPLTSFARNYGNLYMNALIGRGIGRVGPLPYLHKKPPMSSLFFWAVQNPRLDRYRDWFLTSDNVHSRRTLSFGSEMMTCADVTANVDASKSDLVRIMCLSSNNDVRADFYGLRTDVHIFYEVVETSTELPTIRIFEFPPPKVPVEVR